MYRIKKTKQLKPGVGKGGGVELNQKSKLRNVDFPLCTLMLIKEHFYYQNYIKTDCRINTVAFDFLNDLSQLYVRYHLRQSQMLHFEWHKMGMKIKNGWYLQCLGYNRSYQKGYHRCYDTICDLLKDLNLLLIVKDIEDLQDHEC